MNTLFALPLLAALTLITPLAQADTCRCEVKGPSGDFAASAILYDGNTKLQEWWQRRNNSNRPSPAAVCQEAQRCCISPRPNLQSCISRVTEYHQCMKDAAGYPIGGNAMRARCQALLPF